MDSVVQIHNNVYELLMQMHRNNPDLRFTFRKSNRYGRLEKGYWFHGDDYYVTLSFWSGMDWKNRTPTIVFTILVRSGETYLEINTSDSDEKRRFLLQYLVVPLSLEPEGHRHRKRYSQWGADYLASLRAFLETDKPLIDLVLQKHPDYFSGTGDNGIWFIREEDFEEQLTKVDAYRARFAGEPSQLPPEALGRPYRIGGFAIDNFGPIQHLALDDIPFSTQWIFFTGENGTGKTSLLRGLATTLCYRKLAEEEGAAAPFHVSLSLYDETGEPLTFERKGNEDAGQEGCLLPGFASYGASRLRTRNIGFDSPARDPSAENPLYASLFNHDAYLADLQGQLDAWRADWTLDGIYERRKSFITEILTDIFPNVYRIDFDDERNGQPVTSYFEKDSEGGVFTKVSFDQLASGLKSLVAMIGDILIRMYKQQPDIIDPAEFKGLVLIDEIDVHLHPKLQKELVEQLTRTFPAIQFIATTHSPIPLLGAPKGSRIFKVERNSTAGVTLRRLDDKLILGDLLPNTILTSPIFGLEDIVPSSHDAGSLVRTETSYADLTFNDEVKNKINEFLTDEKEQHLIDLFKSRTR
jgi:hypothetical protein